MDPLDVGAVVGLVVRYAEQLASGVLEGALTERLRTVWDAVMNRFREDPVAEGALRRLQDQPSNANRRGAVEDHLQEITDSDPEFTRLLADLVHEAAEAGGDSYALKVDNSGPVATGGSTVVIRGGSHAAGRDLKAEGPQT